MVVVVRVAVMLLWSSGRPQETLGPYTARVQIVQLFNCFDIFLTVQSHAMRRVLSFRSSKDLMSLQKSPSSFFETIALSQIDAYYVCEKTRVVEKIVL